MNHSAALCVVVAGLLVSKPSTAAFEHPVQCLATGATRPSLTSYMPADVKVIVDHDNASRFVALGIAWAAVPQFSSLGTEFKTYHYNYDDAAASGKGPAYVTAPGGWWFCDLPGCYVDSDFASAENSSGQKKEAQIGFGIDPGASASLVPNLSYLAFTRAVAGSGNSSLLKVRVHATKRIAPIGVSGVFLCADMTPLNVLDFNDGVYSPACFSRHMWQGVWQPLNGCNYV